jgi:hypothetical protein
VSFLAPFLLFALPLAALPVIIHLIHLHRRRTVEWAAMMFLFAAQKMNRGYSRLRQYLILAARTAAVLGLIFMIARPLAGGWLGLTGGAPDTVLVLLDRSASMEQQNLSGVTKRSAALTKMAQGIQDLFGDRSKVVLIDSATLAPTDIASPAALPDIPNTAATATTADLPALMQAGLDYITVNQLGRTDVWIASDLRQADWAPTNARWEALRAAFGKLEAVRFHVLAYGDTSEDNLAVTVENVLRRESAEKAELLMDIRVRRQTPVKVPTDVPLGLVINGTRSALKVSLKEAEVLIQGHSVPLDKATKKGWGRVELPADGNAQDNASHFVFDQPAVPMSVIVSDDPDTIGPAKAVLASPAEMGRKQEVKVLTTGKASEIDWERAGLILWQAPLPEQKDILHQQLQAHVEAGRSVIFLPPQTPGKESFMGLTWNQWQELEAPKKEESAVQWWRSSDGLLANARGGQALPLGELSVQRYCSITGDATPLARLHDGQPLLVQAMQQSSGLAAFLTTLPGSAASGLAREGVVWYILLQRALSDGSKSLGLAQQRDAAARVLTGTAAWRRSDGSEAASTVLPLQAGVLSNGERALALNRPAREDSPATLSDEALAELFEGLQFHRVDDSVDDKTDLANEIWRTFLLAMAAAIILEALLCLPKKAPAVERSTGLAAG